VVGSRQLTAQRHGTAEEDRKRKVWRDNKMKKKETRKK
jgi:hypothetical protein